MKSDTTFYFFLIRKGIKLDSPGILYKIKRNLHLILDSIPTQ